MYADKGSASKKNRTHLQENTMNSAIVAFKRFAESSLNYASSETTLSQSVGGFDTIISRDEFEAEYLGD